jgi:hypothetical protein
METLVENNIHTGTIIHFIKKYRDFEKSNLNGGASLIRYLFQEDPKLADHLCDHWRSKKRDFGSFYLNSDYNCQEKFLKHWGIEVDGLSEYLVAIGKNPGLMFTLNKPRTLVVLKSTLLFFNNHGISTNAIPGLNLTMIPRSNTRCYGNSANWADYILSLRTYAEQSRVLKALVEHYDKEQP